MACANYIASGHTAQIYSVIETGGGNGMVTLDQSLEKLVNDGAITPRAAFGLSRYPAQLKQRIGSA
jgi:twitching motility protein PilT